VATLFDRDGGGGQSGFACARSLPYHDAPEPGGGSSAAGGEHPVAGRGQGSGAATQAHALDVVAPWQSGTGASPAKTAGAAGQQTGDGTGLGPEGDVSTSVALPIPALGQNFSRLLVCPGYAQPLGAHEESGSHAPGARGVAAELVPCQSRDFQWCRRGSQQ